MLHEITATKFAHMYQHAYQVLRSDDDNDNGSIYAFKIETITGDKADTTICVKFKDTYLMFWGYASLSLNEIIRKVAEHLQLCDGCHQDIADCADNEPRVHQHSDCAYCSVCYELVLGNEHDYLMEQETMDSLRYA